ncbi:MULTISPECIES: thioredoxin [unclassified Caballeronia]|uniref:thioredoxin n=1 Tax=unclassified Caballeronia TaxID=2646786 RepID=UPI001FD21170|nr:MULTISPECIES: thioredoxin [unclassified Caballeronia]MDR5772432.1 thioredoxin [Caballeronia sp. LZ002]MDR5804123.1 thioredoxin [Caballeronia sp. LZ001]MDR5847866.1 thioredoxin [Caballeronia sp. LZ003]
METTLATFENDVINASMLAPVLVDFWAPWCGPCKTLGPMLERLEAEAAGNWKLVKVNVDENQELAQHFQVRSIPHVIAFAEGRPVDQFIGVLPEGQLREFLDRLVPAGAEAERRAAHDAWASGNRKDAIDRIKATIALDPSYEDARLDLIEWLIAERRIDEAKEEDKLLSPKTTQGIDARYNALKTELDAADAAAGLPPADDLIAAVNAKPDDLEARFALANRLIAGRDYGGALEHLLEIVVRDRAFMDDVGRKTMLSVFELAANQPDVVAYWRRRLSAAMN